MLGVSNGPCATAQRVSEAKNSSGSRFTAHMTKVREGGLFYIEDRWNSYRFVHASDNAPCQMPSAVRLLLQF